MPKSAARKIQDLVIDHAVNVKGYTLNVVRRMIATLNRADAEIFSELFNKLSYMDPDTFTVQRLDSMLESVRTLTRDAYATFHDELRAELGSFTEFEVGFQEGMLSRTMPPLVTVASVNIDQVYAASLSRPFQGALLKEWIADQGEHKGKLIRRAVADGFVQNKTTDQIVREIRGTAKNRYADGLFEVSRREAEAVVRTSLSHTAAFAQDKVYEKNFDLLKEYVWTSTLDARTTPQCQIRDGKRYTATANPQPIGHPYKWGSGPGKLHWNCRSTKSPVPKSWRDLGVPIDEFEPSSRASMDGQVPDKLTYEDWLKDQSNERQDEILGVTRGALFRDGNLGLKELYDNQGEEINLEELRKRQENAFKRAGL